MNLIENAYLEEYDRKILEFAWGDDRRIAICDPALALNPPPKDAAWYLTRRGVTYFSIDRLEEAMQDFNEAIRLQPEGLFPYYWRSKINERLGNAEAAQVDMENHRRLEESFYELLDQE